MKPPAPGISQPGEWPDGFVCPACGHASWLGTPASPGELGMYGLREGDFGDRRHDHAPQPLAPEDLVHGRSHRDQPLERYLRPATPGPASRQLQECRNSCYTSCAVPWSIRIAACLRTWSRSMRPPYRVRTVKDPTAGGQGRSPQGKMRIAGAVELSPEGVSHVASGWRRSGISPRAAFMPSLPGPRRRARGTITDGWSGYCGLPDHDHQPKVVGATLAHLVLTWIHRVFSNLKRWALGTFRHGLRRAHLRRYLDGSCSAGTAAATPQRPSTPCSASARASDPPTTATSSDNAAIPAGRAPATARPPIHLNQGRVPALQPA